MMRRKKDRSPTTTTTTIIIIMMMMMMIVCQAAQRGHRNLSMAWIDVSKAYDSVDHRWLVEMFKRHRFSEWFGFLIGKLSKS